MADYDLKAILGEQLKLLTDKTLKALVDCMCTVGASFCELAARIASLEQQVANSNIGDRTADSLDAQVLKVGGNDVAVSLSGKANASHSHDVNDVTNLGNLLNGKVDTVTGAGGYIPKILDGGQLASSGILETNLTSFLNDSGLVSERDFYGTVSFSDSASGISSCVLDFENKAKRTKVLRLGLWFMDVNNATTMYYYLPLSGTSAAYNGWVHSGQTQAGTTIGGVRIGGSMIYNEGVYTPSVFMRNDIMGIDAIDPETGDTKDYVKFAGIDVGSGTTYNTISRLSETLRFDNSQTDKYVTVEISINLKRDVSARKIYIFGSARCVSAGR